MIKNIIFDFGGVILTDDDAGVTFDNEPFKLKIQATQESLENIWYKYWHDVREKRMTIIQFYNKLQEETVGVVDENISRFMFEEYKSKTRPLKAFKLLSKLKKDYLLYAITNIFSEGLEFKRSKYKLDEYFKIIIASCEVGISKADPNIFYNLINRANIKPSESLFIDDREKNIKVAKELGFETILYDDNKYDAFLDDLKKLSVKSYE